MWRQKGSAKIEIQSCHCFEKKNFLEIFARRGLGVGALEKLKNLSGKLMNLPGFSTQSSYWIPVSKYPRPSAAKYKTHFNWFCGIHFHKVIVGSIHFSFAFNGVVRILKGRLRVRFFYKEKRKIPQIWNSIPGCVVWLSKRKVEFDGVKL